MSKEDNEDNALKGGGGNIAGLKSDIKATLDIEIGAKKDRAEINAAVNAARTALEAKGVPKKILSMGLTYLGFNKENREAFDATMDVIKEVIDENFEPDLFD